MEPGLRRIFLITRAIPFFKLSVHLWLHLKLVSRPPDLFFFISSSLTRIVGNSYYDKNIFLPPSSLSHTRILSPFLPVSDCLTLSLSVSVCLSFSLSLFVSPPPSLVFCNDYCLSSSNLCSVQYIFQAHNNCLSQWIILFITKALELPISLLFSFPQWSITETTRLRPKLHLSSDKGRERERFPHNTLIS